MHNLDAANHGDMRMWSAMLVMSGCINEQDLTVR